MVLDESPAADGFEAELSAGEPLDLAELTGLGADLARILDSLPDAAVLLADRQGRVIYRNHGAESMFDPQGRIGERRSLRDHCPSGSLLPGTFGRFFALDSPEREQGEGYFLKSNGSEFYGVFSVSRFQSAVHGEALLLVIKDIDRCRQRDAEITEKARRLELLTLTDPLTGLYNRDHFHRRLEEELRRQERYNSPLTLLMLDFDHFRRVNDLFGHLVGDRVLWWGAEMLTRALRDVDTISRWGGEEYMLLLPETSQATGLAAAKRLHRLVDEPMQWERLAPGLRMTASLGLVSLPWAGRAASGGEILEILGRALDWAKNNGRDRIVRYDAAQETFEEV